MKNLRIITVVPDNSTNISAKFTEKLSPKIGIDNISIVSETPGISNSAVLSVKIVNDIIEIKCNPLVPFAVYNIIFISTSLSSFKSLNNDAILLQDNISNKRLIIGPVDTDNEVKRNINNFLIDNVYNLEENSIISRNIDILSSILSKCLYDIKQAKNENYLSFTVSDEEKIRGGGPFDRLNQESSYQILRLGKTKTNSPTNKIFSYDNFPEDPITLLKTINQENLTTSSSDISGTFNINSFILNLSKKYVYKLNSIIFTYNDGRLPYNYNIEKYGYQINDSKYDSSFAFTYLLLENNQIKINDNILSDSDFSLKNIFQIEIGYEYKDNGRIINSETVEVYRTISINREVVKPLINIFTISGAPIVKANGKAGEIGDIIFIDPNSFPYLNKKHPAFLYEVEYRLDYLPSRVGEYSVDYPNGVVYVFGSSKLNNGTGEYPPLATYNYKKTFTKNIDYVYDEDFNDLVSLPNGNIGTDDASISFYFEEVLVKNIDYKADLHQESLNERIDNNLVALNAIKTKYSPITDVFRIFNETTGEIYPVSRWNDNKIYFSYIKAPNIKESIDERVSFENINNELLIVSEQIDNGNLISKIKLNNNNIMSATEDCIGSKINSSANFSDTNIFVKEFYYDNIKTESENLENLTSIGYYKINYTDGIIYCVVEDDQVFDIGTISYKRGYIKSNNLHITSVEDLYYKLNITQNKLKTFEYINFYDSLILPSSFDVSDESCPDEDVSKPYLLFNNQIGFFDDGIFNNYIFNNINFIRGIFEYNDLHNNVSPVNFQISSTFDDKTITLASIEQQEYKNVEYDGQYFITLDFNLEYLSDNIALDINVIRTSDGANLWDNSGTIVLGTSVKLILSGVNSPSVNDAVTIEYTLTINDLSRVIIDYNKGDYYINYSYLNDEILVSYEYGDNYIDFTETNSVDEGDTYYVSYKVGALRNALLQNFGSLVGIPILNNFNVDFERERYRDSLIAALQVMPKGPTVEAIKEIVETIIHTPPEIIENAFLNWSLGNSLLYPEKIFTSGNFSLLPAKYGDGVLIDNDSNTIKFPSITNLRIEEGTLSFWLVNRWNGIDNDAQIKLNVNKNNAPLSEDFIFLGASESHPEYLNNSYNIFLNKNNIIKGKPQQNKPGVFIYYDKDISEDFSRWYVDVIDGYSVNYKISVNNIDGKFYDVKSNLDSLPASARITSGNKNINFNINDNDTLQQGFTFVADREHYFIDFGESENKNRFSIFKDETGYLNFRVYDKFKNANSVSTSVSSWKENDKHFISASWNINTKYVRDELHLFIDGFEVPNIIKYGSKISPYFQEKFRTVNPEEIVGVIDKYIVSSNDLITTYNSSNIQSSLNFSNENIEIGDTIYINEIGFFDGGYSITNVNGNTLTLSSNMPATITNGKFTVNKTSFDVGTDVDLYNNITVNLIHKKFEGSDLETVYNSNTVNSSINFEDNEIIAGDLIRINNDLFEKKYIILAVSNNSLVLNDTMPISLSELDFFIYPNEEEEIPGLRALTPSYSISKDGYCVNSITILNDAEKDDIVLIKNLGLNFKKIKKKYYVWGDTNIIKTQLQTPTSLDCVIIKHIILDSLQINSDNSTTTLGIATSDLIQTYQPSNSINGRTLSIHITSDDNIDFSSSVEIIIDGYINNPLTYVPTSTTESVYFDDVGIKDTTNIFTKINNIQVICKPINVNKNYLVIDIKEKYSITYQEVNVPIGPNGSPGGPIVRYSYQIKAGNKLYGEDNIVYDENSNFSLTDVDNYLLIYTPYYVAGYYKIIGISEDLDYLIIESTGASFPTPLPSFSNATYQILNTTTERNGLQNGFFTFEQIALPGIPYLLSEGTYEFEYNTYLSIPFDPISTYIYVGTDIKNKNNALSIINQLNIKDIKITDVRIGEESSNNEESITKDFNLLKPLKLNTNTLMLSSFNTFPFINNSDVYITSSQKLIQSNYSVNDNFDKSVCITNIPIVKENNGILNVKTEGTIEFWISPLFDTNNDPNFRFYFDAYGAVSEEVISINNLTIKIKNKASSIVSVLLLNGNQKINYFDAGTLDSDGMTLKLSKLLPNQNTLVKVFYIPNNLNGDRISIYKDNVGYINFNITASSTDYQVKAPIYWTKGSWHRLKAQYKINGGKSKDEIRLFIDGYERGSVIYGDGLLYGQNVVYGSSYVSENSALFNIKFKDSINQIVIGGEYNQINTSYALIDNLKISNISRPIYKPFNQSMDVGYLSNLSTVYPVTEDLYTTFLLDFEELVRKNDDFATIKNRMTGLFDFYVNIFDSFGITNDNNKIKEIIETLIKALKPANSRAFINYH